MTFAVTVANVAVRIKPETMRIVSEMVRRIMYPATLPLLLAKAIFRLKAVTNLKMKNIEKRRVNCNILRHILRIFAGNGLRIACNRIKPPKNIII